MSRQRTYSDEQLVAAVADSHSWRGVLRALGLTATSGSALRSVRRQADRLGLDYGHFTGQRRWSDCELATAIQEAGSWAEVVASLGLADASSQTALKGHAARLGLDVTHLHGVSARPTAGLSIAIDLANLRRAGSLLAASWFALCGHDVSWPLEPCRYDLLVDFGEACQRIQVKTTTVRSGDSWTVWLSSTRPGGRVPYDPDGIDYFFVIDGDLSYYLIPVRRVGGLQAIVLSAYVDRKVN
jgi:hypothetical protein